MFWRICSLLCGLPQQGIGALGWCVGGHGWLDSFRVEDLAGKMQDLVAGKPKPMAREQPVMTRGSRLADGNESRGPQAWGGCMVRYHSESCLGLYFREAYLPGLLILQE